MEPTATSCFPNLRNITEKRFDSSLISNNSLFFIFVIMLQKFIQDVAGNPEIFFAFSLSGLLFLYLLFGWNRKPRSLVGENVLITGGGMGIGKEMVYQLIKQGCNIIIWDINLEKANEVVEEVKELNPHIHVFAVKCDVSSFDDVKVAASTTRKLLKGGSIDILINNAGIVSGKSIINLTEKDINRTMGVNYFAQCWLVKEFLPDMIEKKHGHIVNIASVMGLLGAANLTDYCSSKFASVGFTHALRFELKKLSGGSVTSTLICPYAISTGMFDGLDAKFQFLLPILKPNWVAKRIVHAIRMREEMVVMPFQAHLIIKFTQLLPIAAQDFIASISGAMDGMDNFTGRHGKKVQ